MKTYKDLIEQNKVFPDSARITSLENKYLSPVEHELEARAKVFGTEVNVFDGVQFQGITFSTAKNMERDHTLDSHTTTRGDQEIPTTGVKTPFMKEDVDQLDEISKTVLQRYKDKASKNINDTSKEMSRERRAHEIDKADIRRWTAERNAAGYAGDGGANELSNKKHDETMGKLWGNIRKRQKGINKADKRLKEDIDDVLNTYLEESYDLTSEIFDLLDNTNAVGRPSQETLKYVASSLRCARDAMLHAIVRVDQTPDYVNEEVDITENFKSGKLNLEDGTTIRLSAADAKALNRMLDSTSAKKNMQKDLMKSKKDFKDMLSFAKDIKEEVDLNEVSIKTLNKYIDKSYKDALDAENKGDLKRFTKRTEGLTKAYHNRARQIAVKNLYKRLGIDEMQIAAPALDDKADDEIEEQIIYSITQLTEAELKYITTLAEDQAVDYLIEQRFVHNYAFKGGNIGAKTGNFVGGVVGAGIGAVAGATGGALTGASRGSPVGNALGTSIGTAIGAGVGLTRSAIDKLAKEAGVSAAYIRTLIQKTKNRVIKENLNEISDETLLRYVHKSLGSKEKAQERGDTNTARKRSEGIKTVTRKFIKRSIRK